MDRTVGQVGVMSLDTASESCRRCIGICAHEDGDNRAVTMPLTRAGICAVATLLVVSVAGCSSAPSEVTASPLASSSITEQFSGPVIITSDDVPLPGSRLAVLTENAPLRIVSLATGVAETLVALGLGDRIVGRDETSTATELSEVPVLTKAHAVSAERVLATSPDLVIIDASTSPPEAIEQIRSAGVAVVQIPEAWSPDDIAPRVRALADAVGLDADSAEAATATWLPSAPGAQPSAPRVAFLYLRGTSAIYLLGGEGSGADALIEAAGGVDVGAESGLPAFTPLTAEALAAADPDVLLVMTGGLESVDGATGLVQLPGVAQTRAGEQGRIVAVEDTLLLSYGPRTGALVDALASALQVASR